MYCAYFKYIEDASNTHILLIYYIGSNRNPNSLCLTRDISVTAKIQANVSGGFANFIIVDCGDSRAC